ncbi:MAG: potassium transporter Kup [Magnetococcales bacterium]|nr:potassium transporter Kup [Magnetococcales bacterium]
MDKAGEAAHHDHRLGTLVMGALGVVFGDIGTSPLYSVKEAIGGLHGAAPTAESVFGIISLVIWALIVMISLKYVLCIMQADNRGEGGIMALVALTQRSLPKTHPLQKVVVLMGMCGVALFFGDGLITPAISVLSAVEGLEVVTPLFKPVVLPITLFVLGVLFIFQSRGTEKVGNFFGPITCLWFLSIAAVGLAEVVRHPEIIWAINPLYGVRFLAADPARGFVALGSVFLCVTGGEALYADMGHFGRHPIHLAWTWFVLPSLALNYLGQGALLLNNPEAVQNPFYYLVPSWFLLPMVGLATAATVIASQAVISGVFSATRQAVQLGFLPHVTIVHTSEHKIGQIYVPVLNWGLLTGVVLVVLAFKSSDNLAAAYGIAVTGAMLIDTFLAFGVVLRTVNHWNALFASFLLVCFAGCDLTFFSANVLKIPNGGWFPLVLGFSLFTVMVTWKRGSAVAREAWNRDTVPFEEFLHQLQAGSFAKVPGTAVFLTADPRSAPRALMHNLSCNCVVHERVIVLITKTRDVPYVPEDERLEVEVLPDNFFRMTLHFGYQESPDIPAALEQCQAFTQQFDINDTYFFLGRAVFVPTGVVRRDISNWRLKLFLAMQRNATSTASYFHIPLERVVELGVRIPIG